LQSTNITEKIKKKIKGDKQEVEKAMEFSVWKSEEDWILEAMDQPP
jgi:hypothetical protein